MRARRRQVEIKLVHDSKSCYYQSLRLKTGTQLEGIDSEKVKDDLEECLLS